MKRILAMLLALVFSFGLLTGCGGTTANPDGEDGATGSRPSIIRFSADKTPVIDPAVGSDNNDATALLNLYDALVYQVNGTQEPCLAEKWEPSEDGLEYTFYLKKGAKFHDGDEVKASDVAFSFHRFITIGEGFSYLFNGVEDCVAVDDYTVKFILKKPSASFMASIWKLYIVNEDLVMANIVDDGTYGEFGDYGKAYALDNDIGSGPYMATELVHQDYLLASKFEDWHMGWEGRENAPEQFKEIFLNEPSTSYTMMANQEMEMTSPWFSPDHYASLDALDGIDLARYSIAETELIAFNSSKAPMDDLNFRKALACLIDYDSLIGNVFVGAQKSVGVVSSTIAGHNPDTYAYQYDIEKAKEYLAQSKYADNYQDFVLEAYLLDGLPVMETTMLSLQAGCAQVGINMEIKKGSWLNYTESTSTPESTYHMGICGIVPPVDDAAAALQQLFSSDTQGTYENPTWSATPEFDAVLNETLEILDNDERYTKAAELQNYVMTELCLYLPVGDLARTIAYQSSYIDWPVAEKYNQGEFNFYAMDMAFFMPDISIYTDR